MTFLILALSALMALLSAAKAGAPDAAGASDAAVPPPGLSVAPDGAFLKDGMPYRGVGANYFDLLLRLQRDPADGSSLEGLKRLGEAGIPFVRFAVAFDDREWRQFFNNPSGFLEQFDKVVRTAERAGVGLIPSLFWTCKRFPEVAGESCDQWGNPESKTRGLMREAVSQIVGRHRGSPAIWAWEFGNEPNLGADLPNAALLRKPGGTERDDLSSGVMVAMLSAFAQEVRKYDRTRPIIAGHSHPRPSAWHNTARRSWEGDSREQTLEILRRDNPAPLDTLGIHIYDNGPDPLKDLSAWAVSHREYLLAVRELATQMKRPVFVGEFAASKEGDPAATRSAFEDFLRVMEDAGVDLAAFWVFDLKNQEKTWSVTFDNERAYMIELSAEANRRWNNQAPKAGTDHETAK